MSTKAMRRLGGFSSPFTKKKSFTMKNVSILILIAIVAHASCFTPLVTQRRPFLVDRTYAQKVENEWIEQDMQKAGEGEEESRDWVAEDMNKVGKVASGVPHPDWIADDMEETGHASDFFPFFRKKSKANKKTADIEKDMRRTGQSTDWVAADMKDAGAPDSHFATDAWLNSRHLDQAMEEGQKNKDYEYIRKDMKKAGRFGSESEQLVEQDVEKTGHGESPLEQVFSFFRDVTYKLDEWQLKAFQTDDIKKDMEFEGHAEDASFIAHDLETQGRVGGIESTITPEQNKDLQEELNESQHSQWISKDMTDGGTPGYHPTKARRSVSDLVAEDLKKIGRMSSDDWIARDMERAGHPDSRSFGYAGSSSSDQYHLEVEEFNAMKHARPKAPVPAIGRKESKLASKDELIVEAKEKVTDDGKLREEHPKHSEHHFVRRALKKAIMPWKAWMDL